MCGPKFCAMKLTRDVREVARERIERGLAEKAGEFKDRGGELYVRSDSDAAE
jgi:phosphomethylpyrimidine synthase